MRKQNLKWMNRALGLALVFGMASCAKDAVIEKAADLKDGSLMCNSQTCDLTAGQYNKVGTLTVSNDNVNLYVTYTLDQALTDQTLGKIHVWAGTDLSLLPAQGNSELTPGQFPYKIDVTGLLIYTVTIPLVDISYFKDCKATPVIYVVAHAEVGEETAFGGCNAVNVGEKGRWYYYFAYNVACCETPSSNLGTAFAKGGYVFTTDKKSNPEKLPSLNLTQNRWGWAININTIGETNYDLWVGAGLNTTSKGIKVGKVTVNYNGSQAVVSYTLNAGYSIEEAHVYVNDLKPTTIAPGQYGIIEYFNPFAINYSVVVDDVFDTNGDGIWVIAHAVAYGPKVVNI